MVGSTTLLFTIIFTWAILENHVGMGMKKITIEDLKEIPLTPVSNPQLFSLCGHDRLIGNHLYQMGSIDRTRFSDMPVAKPLRGYFWGRVPKKDNQRQRGTAGVSGVASTTQLQGLDQSKYSEQSLKRSLLDYLKLKGYTSSSCCSTEWWAVSPVDVFYNGTTYSVYHPSSDEYQVYFEGLCESPGISCMNGGVCAEDRSVYTMVLVLDHLNLEAWPPLRYVPLQANNYCYCTK